MIFFGSIGDVGGSSPEVDEINAFKKQGKISYEERIKIMDKDFPLFNENSSCTDDSILTCAIADALLYDKNYEKYLRKYGLREMNLGVDIYGRSKFGSGFVAWLKGEKKGDSYGNGASMRVSPVGYYFNTLEEVLENAELASLPSHNNPDAIKCAQAVAGSVYLARKKKSKEEIKDFVENILEMKLDFDLENLRHSYKFTSEAINSVPQAIYCFIISKDFEQCLRTSISIGGDTDTIACISTAIAEAYYSNIPEGLKNKALKYIPDYMKKVYSDFTERV
ncbi:MAG: ADP-ribosylglycohydrolase family protein [Clostridia bacterium]|nr:ADP-ribosylglycohydrolase family protein [Clostridia bacterium]